MKTLVTSILFVLSTAASAATAPTALVDYRGYTLPATPVVAFGETGLPQEVRVLGTTARLYAYGTGPAPVTNFGGIKRECGKLDPGHTECYTTSPFETSLVEDSICGYPAAPAVILACRRDSCVSEVFVAECTTAFPERANNRTYSAGMSSRNFAGSLSESEDFAVQSFSSRFDFTTNLNTAMRIVEQGRTPIVGMGLMLFDFEGNLLPDARAILVKAIARFPQVLRKAELPIELFDEPFMNARPQDLPKLIADINAASALVRELLPNARIGITVAPTWEGNANILPSVEAVIHNFGWIATDTYLMNFGEVSQTLRRAKEFNEYVKSRHPNVATWLIVQGFAPVFEAAPQQWGPAEINSYTSFFFQMQEQAARYDGVMVWGWNAVNELQDQYAGKNFPDSIKNLYIAASR